MNIQSLEIDVAPWGNSQGIRIPKKVLDISHLYIGDSIEISAKSGEVVIRKIDSDPPKQWEVTLMLNGSSKIIKHKVGLLSLARNTVDNLMSFSYTSLII